MKRLLLRWRLWRDRIDDRPVVWAVLLGAALIAAIVLAITVGAVSVPLSEIPAALFDSDHPLHLLVWQVRAARIAGAVLVGAALAVAGALLQTVVRNPLADPGLLGVTAAAGTGALLGIVLFPEHVLWVPALAFAGGLCGISIVMVATLLPGRAVGPLRLILSGVALQALFFAGIALIVFFFADRAPAFAAFTVGSLNGASWDDAQLVLGPIVLGLVLTGAALRPLDILLLDDASAAGVGLSVQSARIGVSALSALLTSGAVCIAGLVGFVGLVVPNAVRLLVGPGHRRLLVPVALGGATLVVVADTLARVAAPPLELPVGAILAFVGAPYFLFLLWRKLP